MRSDAVRGCRCLASTSIPAGGSPCGARRTTAMLHTCRVQAHVRLTYLPVQLAHLPVHLHHTLTVGLVERPMERPY
jgi:hypothetical protein